MSAKPEILFLAHRIPFPPDKGDKIRSWRLFSHLAENYRVHLGCFIDDPADLAHRERLAEMSASARFALLNPLRARARSLGALASPRPLSFAWFDDRRMRDYVRAVRRRDLVGEIAFSSSMAAYLDPPVEKRPRLVDLCDADSEKWRAYAETARWPEKWVYALEARRLAAAETAIINKVDAALAVSPAEARTLSARRGVARPVLCFGNGVDTDYFSPDARLKEKPASFDVVFVGAMDYRANAEAALWFARAVWPRLRHAAPAATFAIVGARPTRPVRALDGEAGIRVTGHVEDVRPYLKGARAVIAPLRVARGVQNKVLEAMAMARPVIATSAANAGVEARVGEEILIADDAPSFAGETARLLADGALGAALGAAARSRILKDFTWPAKLAEFDAALRHTGIA